jgi:hypothetical protein
MTWCLVRLDRFPLQHLVLDVVSDGRAGASARGPCDAASDVVAWSAVRSAP